MRAIIEDENAEDGVQLRVSIYYLKKNPILKNFYTHDFILLCLQSYCQNHSLNKKAGNFRILKLESEFSKHVDLNQASRKLGLEMDIFHKLGQTWLNLIELLNQENLWSCDVTENMFICIFRICCLVENRNLQTFYFEPMYMAFKMGSKFDNLSLIETITKPAYSPNFMLSACHEYKDEANEDGNLYFFTIKGMIENRSMRHA